MKAVMAKREDIQKLRATGLSYEAAVIKAAQEVEVSPEHPAYDSLVYGTIAVVEGAIYAKSVAHILDE